MAQRTLIIAPGSIDIIFLKNEMAYMTKYFDTIYVLEYAELGKRGCIRKGKIESIFVRNFTFCSLVRAFWNLITKRELRDEISMHRLATRDGLKKAAYAYLYESFYCNMQKAIGKRKIQGEVYLYSFWLSRGAYAMARYRNESKRKIKKVVSRAHRYDLYEERNALNYLPFRNYIKENLDDIFFISEHGKDYFFHRYGKGRCNYEISRLGTWNREKLKKKVVGKEVICIASCSSISEVKRLDLLIQILQRLQIPYHWIHIGTGELQREMRRYAKERLPRTAYHFLGQVDNSEILKTYQKWDVDFFINVSDSEGIPVSIMEAMSMGIPVICREVGGNKEIVNDENGLLLPESEAALDVSEIEVFLRKRLEERGEYQKMSDCCIRGWKEKYSAKKNYEEFYNAMVREKSFS